MAESLDIVMADDAGITRAAAVLREGGLVAFPTETVYGLGANALDVEAVAKVFEAKARPHFDPLIVHVADPTGIEALVEHVPPLAWQLAEAFWPGPLTLVLPKRPIVPDLVTAGLGTVAVRVPAHEVARKLIEAAGVPVAAPSANRFGGVSPTRAEHVRDEFAQTGGVDMILDGGPCTTGVESTVLSLIGDAPVLLRPGGTAIERIEAVIGPVKRVQPTQPDAADSQAQRGQVSPGMLERHYAPRTPLRLVDPADVRPVAGKRTGVLVLRDVTPRETFAAIEVLSPTGDLHEAAANLFAAMRRLDAADVDVIVAERVPDQGLGLAINDRLQRAGVRD